jgi:hypothetical protein
MANKSKGMATHLPGPVDGLTWCGRRYGVNFFCKCVSEIHPDEPSLCGQCVRLRAFARARMVRELSNAMKG